MTMDYNKWGVVSGIVGLVLLLTGPLLSLLAYLLNSKEFASSLFIILYYLYFLRYLSMLFVITTIILGVLSIKIGNKQKTALVFGIICFLLLILKQFFPI